MVNQLSFSEISVSLLYRGPICRRKIKLVHDNNYKLLFTKMDMSTINISQVFDALSEKELNALIGREIIIKEKVLVKFKDDLGSEREAVLPSGSHADLVGKILKESLGRGYNFVYRDGEDSICEVMGIYPKAQGHPVLENASMRIYALNEKNREFFLFGPWSQVFSWEGSLQAVSESYRKLDKFLRQRTFEFAA